MDDHARRSRGNSRGTIALVVLTAIAAFVAWRRAPDGASEESSTLASEREDDAIGDETPASRATPDRGDAGAAQDAGITTRIVPMGGRGRYSPRTGRPASE